MAKWWCTQKQCDIVDAVGFEHLVERPRGYRHRFSYHIAANDRVRVVYLVVAELDYAGLVGGCRVHGDDLLCGR